MSDTATRSWVWYSTPASRVEGRPSILALLETTLCIAAYWALWKWLGVTWHHWLIVMATPLFLLRSDQSEKLGAKWFDDLVKNITTNSICGQKGDCYKIIAMASASFLLLVITSESIEPAVAVRLSLVLIALYAALRTLKGLSDMDGLKDNKEQDIFMQMLFVTVLFGISAKHALEKEYTIVLLLALIPTLFLRSFSHFVTDGFMHKNVASSILYGFLLIPGISIGLILRAIFVRVLSTFIHIRRGGQRLPRNWAEHLSAIDSFLPPVLVPESKFGSFDRLIWELPAFEGEEHQANGLRLTRFTVSAITLAPTILLRWSIKSTAWFYFPLALVAKTGMAETDTARASLAKAYSRKLINILFLLAAIISLATAATALVRPDWLALMLAKTSTAGAPAPFVGYVFVLDWSRIADQPWQWAYLPSAALSVLLFFLYDNIGRNIEHGIPEARYYPRLRLMQRAANASLVLTLAGLCIALWYFARAMWSWDQLRAGLFWWL